MPFEHHHDAAIGRQLNRRVVAGVAVQLPADQPGELAGVRGEDPRAAGMRERFGFGRQGIQRVGVEDHRLGHLLIEPDHERIQAERAAQARPAGHHGGRPGQLDDPLEGGRSDPAGVVGRQRHGHVGRLEAGDSFEARLGHGQPHQSGAAAEGGHAGQGGGPGHAPRSAHDQGQAEIALVGVVPPRRKLGKFVIHSSWCLVCVFLPFSPRSWRSARRCSRL